MLCCLYRWHFIPIWISTRWNVYLKIGLEIHQPRCSSTSTVWSKTRVLHTPLCIFNLHQPDRIISLWSKCDATSETKNYPTTGLRRPTDANAIRVVLFTHLFYLSHILVIFVRCLFLNLFNLSVEMVPQYNFNGFLKSPGDSTWHFFLTCYIFHSTYGLRDLLL